MAKYERIADDLRRRILSGDLEPGSRIDTESALATAHRVSTPTIRQALNMLDSEGLIERQHGKGTFVRKPRKTVQRRNDRHQWEKDRARRAEEERKKTGSTEHDTGLTVDDLVFSAEYEEIEASEQLAETLGVSAGTRLLERTYRTRYRNEDAPFNVSRSFLIYDLVAKNPDLLDPDKEPWPGGTQSQLHTVGIEIDHVIESFTARPPTPDEAEELGIRTGVAVIVLRKTLVDTNGKVVEVAEVTMPGDRTELIFTTHLDRW